MRVKCIKKYFDRELNKRIELDTEFDVSDARARVLIGAKVCEEVTTTTTPEKVAKPRKKKEA
jgi:hypothetical protein